jgi:hypothetical protein
MSQPLGNCPGCEGDELFEQIHAGDCPDADGGDCPEWACTGCGTAVIMGTVVTATAAVVAPAAYRPVRAALPTGPATTYARAMRRLAEGSAPGAASGQAEAVTGDPGPSSRTARGDCVSDDIFRAAVAAFEAGRDAVAEVRDDITFEDHPAPRRLAPYATAMAATAYRDGAEAGTGRIMLLYDPAGQDGWTGPFRVVAQVDAEVEEEIAADPMLGEVGWSWLTDALNLHAPGYSAPSGTVTRVITEGFGVKEGEPPSTGFELRASWCPADADFGGDVAAWCDLIAAAAGLPAQPPGTRALRSGRRRRK